MGLQLLPKALLVLDSLWRAGKVFIQEPCALVLQLLFLALLLSLP